MSSEMAFLNQMGGQVVLSSGGALGPDIMAHGIFSADPEAEHDGQPAPIQALPSVESLLADTPGLGQEQSPPPPARARRRVPRLFPFEPDPEPPGPAPWRCQKCGKTLNIWKRYLNHIKSHDYEKPFKCDKCPEAFNFQKNWELHAVSHAADPTPCPDCGRAFRRVASLRAHLALHEVDEAIVCPQCQHEFPTQVLLDKHLPVHTAPAAVNLELVPGTVADADADAELGADPAGGDNVLKPSNIKRTCTQCKLVFATNRELLDHHKEHQTIRSILKLQQQRRRTKPSSRPSTRCQICQKSFAKPGLLRRHQLIHTGEKPFKCEICDRAFNQKSALKIHRESKHGKIRPYQCTICKMFFAQRGNLRNHVRRVHNLSEARERIFKCEHCGCGFATSGVLGSHISKMHDPPSNTGMSADALRDLVRQLLDYSAGNAAARDRIQAQIQEIARSGVVPDCVLPAVPPPRAGEPTRDKRPAIITVVDKMVQGRERKHLVRVRYEGRLRWFQCLFCAKEFRKPYDLVRHLRIHTKDKPFRCPQCFRQFTVRSGLESHLRAHRGIKLASCPICHKKFSTAGVLKVHLRLHTGAKPYHCQYCEKQCRTLGQIQAHEAAHRRTRTDATRDDGDDADERKRASPDSGPEVRLQPPILITSSGMVQVDRPRRIEIPEGDEAPDRPHRCTQCRAAFKKVSHLKQHMRWHTGEKPHHCPMCNKSFMTSSVLATHLRTHTGARLFKCPICSHAFTTKSSMTRHMTTHTQERPYMCPYCQRRFKTRMICKKHTRCHKFEIANSNVLQNQLSGGLFTDLMTPEEEPLLSDAAYTTRAQNVSVILDEHGQMDGLAQLETALKQQLFPASELAAGLSQVKADMSAEHRLMLANIAAIAADESPALGAEERGLPGGRGPGGGHRCRGAEPTPKTRCCACDPSLSQPLIHRCRVCKQLFTTQLALAVERRMRRATPVEFQPASAAAHLCDRCLIVFSTAEQLAEHSPLTAGRSHSETCLIQSAVEKMQNGPTQRSEPESTEGLKHSCETCSKTFRKPLRPGAPHAHPQPARSPTCGELCFKRFTVKSTLLGHLKTHTGERNFECLVCKARFATKCSLKVHSRLHTDTRPYQCEVCRRWFRTSVTGASTWLSTSGPAVVADALVEGEFTCSECPRSFRLHPLRPPLHTQNALVAHRRTHEGDRPFDCPFCEHRFAQRGNMRTHIRRAHLKRRDGAWFGDRFYTTPACCHYETTVQALHESGLGQAHYTPPRQFRQFEGLRSEELQFPFTMHDNRYQHEDDGENLRVAEFWSQSMETKTR
ncbi:zinc finger protein 236-like [Pollicipes pollicipes]|uniref:zinc finger protein 236-like n=1 Tax=Pollicipes pollicipes TaxID=41117 RepID=UPI001885063D|nr:zinc finger protein 236-like [Pollicipes pollicipes]